MPERSGGTSGCGHLVAIQHLQQISTVYLSMPISIYLSLSLYIINDNESLSLSLYISQLYLNP